MSMAEGNMEINRRRNCKNGNLEYNQVNFLYSRRILPKIRNDAVDDRFSLGMMIGGLRFRAPWRGACIATGQSLFLESSVAKAYFGL